MMLAFDDLSAVGDPDEIVQLAARRRARAKMMSDLVDEVDKAQQSSVDPPLLVDGFR